MIDDIVLFKKLAGSSGSSGGGGTEMPTFDLTALGLPAITPGGSKVEVNVDASAIRAALDAGLVRLGFTATMTEGTFSGTVVVTGMYISALDTYQCVCIIKFGTTLFMIDFNFESARVYARSTILAS